MRRLSTFLMETVMHLSYSVYLLCTKSVIALFSKTFTGVYPPLLPAILRRGLSLHEVETWKALTSAVPLD